MYDRARWASSMSVRVGALPMITPHCPGARTPRAQPRPFCLGSLSLLNASLRGWVQRALRGLHAFGNSWGSPGQPGNQLLVDSERYVAARRRHRLEHPSGAQPSNLPRWPMTTPTRFRLDEGFEYGDAATTSRKSLAARRAVDAGKWRPAAPKAPRQRNAAPVHRGVQTASREQTDSTDGKAGTGAFFRRELCRRRLDSHVLRHGPSRQRLPAADVSRADVATPGVRTPPATALMPRWAARETRATTTSGVGRQKAAKSPRGVVDGAAVVPAGAAPDGPHLRRGLAPRGGGAGGAEGQLSSPAAGTSTAHRHSHVGRRPRAHRTTINARSRISSRLKAPDVAESARGTTRGRRCVSGSLVASRRSTNARRPDRVEINLRRVHPTILH